MKTNLGSSYVSTFSKFNTKSNYLNLRNLLLKSKDYNPKNIKVKMVKLEEINILKKKKIDLIKIDVEGYELKVLQGAKKILKNTKCIIIEFHYGHLYKNIYPKKINKLLVENNFKLIKKIKFPFLKWEDRIYIK